MDADELREGFEKWAAAPGGLFDHARGRTDWSVVGGYKSDDEYNAHFLVLTRKGDDYTTPFVQDAWKGYRAAFAAGLERAAEVCEAEPELPGEPPAQFLELAERVGPVENARGAVRGTKASIARAIRALAREGRG